MQPRQTGHSMGERRVDVHTRSNPKEAKNYVQECLTTSDMEVNVRNGLRFQDEFIFSSSVTHKVAFNKIPHY